MEASTRAPTSQNGSPASAQRMACRVARAPMILALLFGCHRDAEPSGRVLVTNENDGTISVIDARTYEVTTIAVGKRPRGVRVARDGKTAFVALSGSPKAGPGVDERTLPPPDRSADGIGVIDLENLALVTVLPSGQDPETFDLVGDGELAVSNEETAEVSLVDVGTRRVRARVSVGGEPEGVTTAPDGVVWVTSEADHRIYAIEDAKVTASLETGARPRTIAFTADGKLGVVGGEADGSILLFDPKQRVAVAKLVVPNTRPMGIAVVRDRAYVTTGRSGAIAIVDLASRTVEDRIDGVGARPWGIALGRDGMLYTANGPSNDVSVIDPATRTVVRRIPTGGSPWGVASL
jgi:YVTN family beta-propeller protein